MAFLQAPDFAGLLQRLTQALEARQIPFMLIGGQAVLLHGRPRLTEDIDATVGLAPSELPRLREACGAAALHPLPTDVEGFVRDTFVLPVRDEATGVRVDLVFSTTPYERQAIARADRVMVGPVAVPFATAEDLIIHKLFAGRAMDLEDAASVVRRKGEGLDWGYIDRWVKEFATIPGREDMPERAKRVRSQRS
jgi:nucleotidyltransferase AbiEii toxin of type IV toxin-antitoxin system